MQLDKVLHAWGTPDFKAALKREIERMSVEQLPLQQGLTTGNYVLDKPRTATVNNMSEAEHVICATVGIFYQSVIAGCSCADDPTPTNENNEYCEIRLDINKITAEASVTLI